MLLDSFNRLHDNLRISVTDRCNLRCVYCMPEEVTFQPKEQMLSFEEMAEFVRVAAPLGIRKVRLTGGEPLMRKNIDRLVKLIVAIPGIVDVGLTTNGLLLADQAETLAKAGLKRLNVSLDTLDPDRFRTLSRRDGLDEVLAGLQAATAAGFTPVKLNAVIIRGINETDVVPLARYCREQGFEMRFIEYMPIGAEKWEREKVYFAHEMLEALEAEFGAVLPAKHYDPHAPAMEFAFPEGDTFGIIASVSRPFCRSCNRLRLTADGKLRNCLFALDETDVKGLLRAHDEAGLQAAIRENVLAKWEGHEINTAKFVKPTRTMHAIGG